MYLFVKSLSAVKFVWIVDRWALFTEPPSANEVISLYFGFCLWEIVDYKQNKNMADANPQTVEYQWAYSIMDSSRVSTFLISMLLIVYGSFRSLNMEQEARERASGSTNCLLNPNTSAPGENNVQTLDTVQALCLPLGASISLLVMFFFFDSMQMLFAICTASKCLISLYFS